MGLPLPFSRKPLVSIQFVSWRRLRPHGGGYVALSATVTGTSPTGTVQFLDKGVVIAQASLVSGTATASVMLKGGNCVLSAHYLGDASNAASTSADTSLFVDISNIMAPILQLLLD